MSWEDILKQNRRFSSLGEAKIAAKELAQQRNKVQILARLPQSQRYAVEEMPSAFLDEDRDFNINRDVLTTFNTEGIMTRFDISDFMMTDRQRLFSLTHDSLKRGHRL